MGWYHALDQQLRGAPDQIVTGLLLALAAIALLAAVAAPRPVKAAIAGWFALP